MTMTVTTHDIKIDGVRFNMELRIDEDDHANNYIMLTEYCDGDCESHQTFDFKGVS